MSSLHVYTSRVRRLRLEAAVLLTAETAAYNIRSIMQGVCAFLLVWIHRPAERDLLGTLSTSYLRTLFNVCGSEVLRDFLRRTRPPAPRLTMRFFTRMFARTAAEGRIISSPPVRRLQGRIIERIFSGRLGIRPTDRELDILSRFADAAVLYDGLLAAADCGSLHRIDGETRLRCTVVFGAFVQGLRVYLGRCAAAGKTENVLTFEPVYPQDLDRNRSAMGETMLRQERDHAAVRLRTIRTGRILDGYLSGVGLLSRCRRIDTATARRILNRLERIYFI